MTPIRSILSRLLPLAVPALVAGALTLGAPAAAHAQVRVRVVFSVPPPAYIATVVPEYYEGRPVYFYNNSWYYRDHGRWLYYRHEPRYLHDRRSHFEAHRHADGHVVRGPHRYHYSR